VILGVNGVRLLGRRTGVGRVIEGILGAMDGVEHPFDEVRIYTPRPLDRAIGLPAVARNVVLPSHLPLGLWEQWVLPRAHGARHLLLCPSYVAPLRARCPIFLIHHGSYEGHPDGFGWWELNKARWLYTQSARRATVVSTVSEHSRRDIARFYGIDADRIHVIPAGVDTRAFHPIDDSERLSDWRSRVFGRDVPFLVYVGKPAKRRNLPALVEAFGLLKREAGIPHQLLLIGTGLPGHDFEAAVVSQGLRNEVVRLDFLPHEEVALAYNAADLLVYPSSYEGFGMPVLEAMACGTPAIALDSTAFPEFAGGVARLLPDAKVETLRRGIESLLCDPDECARMSEEGPKRAASYDWRIVAPRYLELMARVARERASLRL
jgi:glycosyltransferase involved in cell wall biosynthesis